MREGAVPYVMENDRGTAPCIADRSEIKQRLLAVERLMG